MFMRNKKIIVANRNNKKIGEKRVKFNGKQVEVVGSIKFNKELETKHTLIVGSSGSGKTVILRRLYRGIKEHSLKLSPEKKQKIKMIIHDTQGDWIRAFYNSETDYIFNPLDIRHMNWNIFSIIKTIADLRKISSALIPENPKIDPLWIESPRAIFEGGMKVCIAEKNMNNASLKALFRLDRESLLEKFRVVEGCESAYNYLNGAGQADNVFSNFMSYIRLLDGVLNSENKEFNINEFLEKGTGTIFLGNFMSIQDVVSPFISLFLDSLTSNLLEMKNDEDRRIHFFLDEFASLKKMDSVVNLITKARKNGGCVYLGLQTYTQMKEIYGENLASTIFGNTSTKMFFQVSDTETKKYLSDTIGEKEEEVSTVSNSTGTEENRDGQSYNAQIMRSPAVLESEFTSLQEHQFYFFQRGSYWCKIEGDFMLDFDIYEEKENMMIMNSGFIIKEMNDFHNFYSINSEGKVEIETLLEKEKIDDTKVVSTEKIEEDTDKIDDEFERELEQQFKFVQQRENNLNSVPDDFQQQNPFN